MNGTFVRFVCDLSVAFRTKMICIMTPTQKTWEAGADASQHPAYDSR